jgi:cytidine diphosphoramidate kinase
MRGDGGHTIWITGLSGAGKTTVSRMLDNRLRELGVCSVLLDGDALRDVFGGMHDHSPQTRRMLAMSYARLCRELSAQGLVVVCATMSMFHEVRRWNRENIRGYYEVYLKVPVEELRRRDAKGIYARAERGEIADVVGVHIPAEEPEEPDLLVDNHGLRTPEETVALILEGLGLRAEA